MENSEVAVSSSYSCMHASSYISVLKPFQIHSIWWHDRPSVFLPSMPSEWNMFPIKSLIPLSPFYPITPSGVQDTYHGLTVPRAPFSFTLRWENVWSQSMTCNLSQSHNIPTLQYLKGLFLPLTLVTQSPICGLPGINWAFASGCSSHIVVEYIVKQEARVGEQSLLMCVFSVSITHI